MGRYSITLTDQSEHNSHATPYIWNLTHCYQGSKLVMGPFSGNRCIDKCLYVVMMQYGIHEGTSQSAGFVAGAAALLLAAYRQAGYNVTGAMMKDPLMRGVLPSAQLATKCKAGEHA